jgi:hypothetical protein
MSSRLEIARRVTDVFRWLLEGKSRDAIVELVGSDEVEWTAAPRTVDVYIAKARQRLEALSEVRREAELGKAIARLDALYEKALAEKQIRTALAIERERIILLGLKAPERIEITEIVPQLDAEIERRRHEIERLERQYAEPAADPRAGA